MNYPYIYRALNRPEIIALMGGVFNFWHEGEIPAEIVDNPPPTRIIWSIPGGIEPSRYYADPSDIDLQSIEVSVYSNSLSVCGSLASLVRKYLFNMGEEGFIYTDYEPETKLHRIAIQYVFAVNT